MCQCVPGIFKGLMRFKLQQAIIVPSKLSARSSRQRHHLHLAAQLSSRHDPSRLFSLPSGRFDLSLLARPALPRLSSMSQNDNVPKQGLTLRPSNLKVRPLFPVRFVNGPRRVIKIETSRMVWMRVYLIS